MTRPRPINIVQDTRVFWRELKFAEPGHIIPGKFGGRRYWNSGFDGVSMSNTATAKYKK